MEVLGVGQWLGELIPILWVLRYKAPEHCGSRTIEWFNLVICLRVLCPREGVCDSQNAICFLLEFRLDAKALATSIPVVRFSGMT